MRFSDGISTPNNLGIVNLLSLALFMARVFADHTDNILPFNDLARFTKSLN